MDSHTLGSSIGFQFPCHFCLYPHHWRTRSFYNFFLGYDWKLPKFYKQRVLSTLLIQEYGVFLQEKIYKSLHILERNKKKRKNNDIYFADYQSTICTCNMYCYSQLKRLWSCLLRPSKKKEGEGGVYCHFVSQFYLCLLLSRLGKNVTATFYFILLLFFKLMTDIVLGKN